MQCRSMQHHSDTLLRKRQEEKMRKTLLLLMLHKATSKLERHCGTSQGCPGVGSGSGLRDESPSNFRDCFKVLQLGLKARSTDSNDQQCPMILLLIDRDHRETRQNHTKNKKEQTDKRTDKQTMQTKKKTQTYCSSICIPLMGRPCLLTHG